ncbi:MAG: hypothetical protein PHN88_10240 [Ignavibacteria bacterium]|nr:hypothetical protein [Ignavibacteria bacterium]
MKKVFAISLVFLFLINDFSFVSIYLPLKSLAKYINFETKNTDKDDPDITTIVLSKSEFSENNDNFRKIDEDEIIYENELYDVRSYQEENDSVIIYCVKDVKENSLDKIFSVHVEQNANNKLASSFQNIINNKRFSAYLIINPFILEVAEISAVKTDIPEFTSAPFLKIEIPPPKLS